MCHGEKSDPQNAYGVARDEPLSADGDVENILQMSPQEVNLTVRISEFKDTVNVHVLLFVAKDSCTSYSLNCIMYMYLYLCYIYDPEAFVVLSG